MTELGKHRLGRHSAAELNPALDDYQLASALVREAGTLALLMRQAGLRGPAEDLGLRRRHSR